MNEFEQFWAICWRRVGKLAAEKAFARARRKASFEAIMLGVDEYKRHMPRDVQFQLHPATFLNQGRWSDEYERPRCAPVIEGRKDCRHEPRCPSNEWHQIMLQRDREQARAS